MNAPLTLTSGFREGADYPSPVTRVVAFGYYDGPTEGVLQVGPAGEVYYFVMTDEFRGEGADETDLRSFALSPLPPDSLGALVGVLAEALSPVLPPNWSLWVPVWHFPSPAIQKDMESRVDRLVESAGPAVWQFTTENLLGVLRSVKRLPSSAAPRDGGATGGGKGAGGGEVTAGIMGEACPVPPAEE